jgi:hypothetical protein
MKIPEQDPEPSPSQTRNAIRECTEELRTALADHGIKLPSLGPDLTTFAGEAPYPLVALGNCRLDTARRLIEVLRSTEHTKSKR